MSWNKKSWGKVASGNKVKLSDGTKWIVVEIFPDTKDRQECLEIEFNAYVLWNYERGFYAFAGKWEDDSVLYKKYRGNKRNHLEVYNPITDEFSIMKRHRQQKPYKRVEGLNSPEGIDLEKLSEKERWKLTRLPRERFTQWRKRVGNAD